MSESPKPLEESDPELAEMFRKIASKESSAIVIGTRVFRYIVENGRRRIAEEIRLEIGRNDPCICGSGKKQKKCCGDLT